MIIEYLSEPKEDWFVEIIRYKRTDEVIVEHAMITRDQIEDRIDRDKRLLGFKIMEQ